MIQELAPLPQLGSCGFLREGAGWTLTLDALAFAGGVQPVMYLFSAVGPSTAVKAVTAILRGDIPATFWTKLPGEAKQKNHYRHHLHYDVFRHRLAFDQWHLLAVAKDPLLIANLSQRSLWREFSGPRFTTPILRTWTPWLAKHFLATNRLRKITCFRCDAAVLAVEPRNLDEAVTSGIKKGELSFG